MREARRARNAALMSEYVTLRKQCRNGADYTCQSPSSTYDQYLDPAFDIFDWKEARARRPVNRSKPYNELEAAAKPSWKLGCEDSERNRRAVFKHFVSLYPSLAEGT